MPELQVATEDWLSDIADTLDSEELLHGPKSLQDLHILLCNAAFVRRVVQIMLQRRVMLRRKRCCGVVLRPEDLEPPLLLFSYCGHGAAGCFFPVDCGRPCAREETCHRLQWSKWNFFGNPRNDETLQWTTGPICHHWPFVWWDSTKNKMNTC